MIDPRTFAALWLAQTQAATALALAAMGRPWIAMGDVYLPFGRDYAQDIDPVTFWGPFRGLARTGGMRPGSPEAARFLVHYGEQQALVRGLLARVAEAQPETPGERVVVTATAEEFRELARCTERLAALAGGTPDPAPVRPEGAAPPTPPDPEGTP
jgi:hypothetical protein